MTTEYPYQQNSRVSKKLKEVEQELELLPKKGNIRSQKVAPRKDIISRK
jgi:hypothetical protein